MRWFARSAAILFLLWFAGCREALSPGDVSGTYALYRYDGASPPRDYTTEHGCTVTVYGGELDLGADGRFSVSVDRARRCPGTSSLEWVGFVKDGNFDLSDGHLWLLGGADTPGSLLARIVGTHIVVDLPQAEGISPSVIVAEFAAGVSGGRNTTAEGTGTTGPPPQPPDTSSVVIIIKRR